MELEAVEQRNDNNGTVAAPAQNVYPAGHDPSQQQPAVDSPVAWHQQHQPPQHQPQQHHQHPPMSEHQQANGEANVSWLSLMICFSVLFVWILIWLQHPPFALAFPLLLLPAFGILRWWRLNRFVTDFESVIVSYGLGMWPFYLAVFLTQAIAFSIVHVILTAIWFKPASDEATDGQYFFFLILFAFFISGAIQESFKLLFCYLARRRSPDPTNDTRANLMYATAAALGFATMNNIILVAFEVGSYDANRFGDQFGSILLLIIMFTAFNTSIHCLTAYLLGLAVSKQRMEPAFEPYDILAFCVAVRGLLLLEQLSFLAFVPVAGAIILVVVVSTLIMLGVVMFIKRFEGTFPQEYLRRVGHLNHLGYGMVGMEVEHAEEPEAPQGQPDRFVEVVLDDDLQDVHHGDDKPIELGPASED